MLMSRDLESVTMWHRLIEHSVQQSTDTVD